MLRLRLRMAFEPQAYDEAAGVLRSLIGPIRAETGCTATRLLKDTDGSCELTWVEEWRSIEDFEQHLRADVFRRMLAVIELAAAQPVVEIDDVASRRGLELLEELLGLTPAASGPGDRHS